MNKTPFKNCINALYISSSQAAKNMLLLFVLHHKIRQDNEKGKRDERRTRYN